MITRLRIDGMSCQHCVDAVRAEVSAIPGVTDVIVDLSAGAVTVASATEVDDAMVAAAIDEAGYTLLP